MPDMVSNQPFREEFLRNEDITADQVCRAAGWMRRKKGRNKVYIGADNSQLKRKLGLVPDYRYKGSPVADQINYDEAVKLLPVFGFDPVDVDV